MRPTAQDLQAECQTVDIGAVVCNDAKGQDNETELAKAAERREKDCCKQTANAGALVTLGVNVGPVGNGGGCDSQTEHFGEAEREN